MLSLSAALRDVEGQYHAFKSEFGIQNLEQEPGQKGPEWRHAVVSLDRAIEKLAEAVKRARKEYPGL